MADATNIEWTDATWNPTTGCDRVSPGCDNCYAMTLAPRLKAMGSPRYQNDGNPATSGPGFGFTMHPEALDQPLRWTRPRRIFVNSMSDLFHSDMDPYFLARVFAVMALARQHTFQVLTKRPGRMRSILRAPDFYEQVNRQVMDLLPTVRNRAIRDRIAGAQSAWQPLFRWPLPNVWLGTSVEDQKRADLRIPALLDTPAAVRFLSCEPLLGPVDLTHMDVEGRLTDGYWINALSGRNRDMGRPCRDVASIDWVIVGGESGRGARPMHPDWARSLRDQCTAARVPFLFKQWGGHDEHGTPMHKKAAGRELDGRTWDEFPVVA